jgi:hypothetical protein
LESFELNPTYPTFPTCVYRQGWFFHVYHVPPMTLYETAILFAWINKNEDLSSKLVPKP